MGGSGGGTKQTQTGTTEFNPMLQPLYGQTAATVQGYQPMISEQFGEFFQPNPQSIPGQTTGAQYINDLQFSRAVSPWETTYDTEGTGVARTFGQTRGPEDAALLGAQGYGALRAPEHQALYGSGTYGSLRDPEAQAIQQINYMTGGPLGQAPATQAAMAAARNPALNDLALSGLGNSDAVASNLTAAYAPILAQEMASRQAATGQLSGIGSQQRYGDIQSGQLQAELGQAMRGGDIASGQLQSQIGQAMRNGDISLANYLANQGQTMTSRGSQLLAEAGGAQEAARQVGSQQGEATYNDLLRRQGLASEFTTGILSGVPSIAGQKTVTKGSGGSTGK